ncbi:ribonuclease HII [Helicobacter sp. 11S02629-2]|uniref:ribonuclease HII n=1 Tax=Helicobacter sp. 11S02629-2 TaxID=1476195 RepID=UPI002151FB1E|nr:ribonuclease HII [Helicobacter sp. 11S02629-2]
MDLFECGIDEAGRGCIAGSMFVVGVVGDFKALEALGVKDSKTLSQKRRNALALKLLDAPEVFYYAYKASATKIDAIGLSACLKEALSEIKVYFSLLVDVRAFVFDGNCNYGVEGIKTLVRGDGLHPCIKAASILAKYYKDEESRFLDKRFPRYKLAKNKGYLTKEHLEFIKTYGLTEVHRASYKIKSLQG